MISILFRVNAGPTKGLGHLTRCIALSDALEANGVKCIFLVDNVCEQVLAFLTDKTVHTQQGTDDAQTTVAIALKNQCKLVIVDDYDLGIEWETKVRSNGLKLMVIDDTLRQHNCDYLLDYRWRGQGEGASAYEDLVPTECTRLLGPAYVLLGERYEKPYHSLPKDGAFNLTIGFGGAGSYDFAYPLIDTILQKIEQQINIRIIIGPLFEGGENFRDTFKEYKNIRFITGETNLFDTLQTTDLYVGPAGSIIYQLRALNITALTYSVADNQANSHKDLEDIGHYFHINGLNFDRFKHIATAINTMIVHIERIKKLSSFSLYPIDGYGAKRVTQILLGHPPTPYEPQSNPYEVHQSTFSTPHYELRQVNDRDINAYLDARNLDANREKMTQEEKIDRLAHYSWWFNTKRQSYLLLSEHKPALYIWHDSFIEKDQEFLIGGWFVCREDTTIQDSLTALSWQLDYCAQQHPDANWLAVINRHNKSVKLLNDYMGFTEIDEHHPYFNATQNAFPDATIDKFHFVIRPSFPNPSEKKARTQ